MLSKGKLVRPLTAVALAMGAISLVLRTLSVLFFFDSGIMYYSVGAVLPVISSISIVLFAIALGAAALCLVDKSEEITPPASATCYTASIVSLGLIYNMIDLGVGIASRGLERVTDLFTLVAAAFAVAFFLMLSLSKQHGSAAAICGSAIILWLGLVWMRSYTDFYVPMNSPDKIFFHLGCIGAALLTVAELRSIYGITKPRFYCFSLWCSILFMASASVPTTVGAFVGGYSDPVSSENYVLSALLIYACARAVQLIVKKNLPETAAPQIPQQPDPAE